MLAFSLHAPTAATGRYIKQVNAILDELKRITAGRPFALAGDFNLSVSDCSLGARKPSKQETAIQLRLADEFGLLNCWQAANPGVSPVQTLRWTNDPLFPYHCDGIFVPKAWGERLRSCMVLSGPEWDRLSDHNPVVATFGEAE